jgi:antirestriction protein
MTSSKAAARTAIDHKMIKALAEMYIATGSRAVWMELSSACGETFMHGFPVGGEELRDAALRNAEAAAKAKRIAMKAREKAGVTVPSHPRKNPSKTKKATPRIYVANLAAYNSGRLKGKWIEPSTDADELAEQIADAIGGNVDRDEWAFHDYDAFPNMGENPDLDDVAAMAEIIEEHPYAIVKAAMSFVWNNDRQDIDSLKEWLDEGYGIYESKKDYVEQYVDDMGGPSKLGKQTIDSYFDYDAFGHDVLLDDIDEEDRARDRERYAGMSDEEIGMQYMDEVYGDKIPADLADRYFDYDAYARDVFMEVASVRTPEGLVVFNAR